LGTIPSSKANTNIIQVILILLCSCVFVEHREPVNNQAEH